MSSSPISSAVVLVGVYEVHFAAAARKLHIGLVFINRLERGVVGDRAVTQRQPPRLGDAFACMLAAQHLRSEKELLDLIFSEGGIVSGSGSARANEASHCSENEPPPVEIMSVHRVPSRMVSTNLRPMPVDQQPMDIRGEQQETRGRFQHIKERVRSLRGPFPFVSNLGSAE